MNILEEHQSPDRLLRLLVTRDDDGDTTIGLDGYSWHTHGDCLAALSGLTEEESIRNFVDQIIGDGQIIVVSRVNGEIRDIWPTDHPQREYKYKPPEESLEFRRWSGATVQVSPGE
jgi:hypothetical protein